MRRPAAATSEDPIWRDYQWVAMLDPVELADGIPRGRAADPGSGPGPGPGVDADPPAALDVHRLDASVRHGRDTWWAEVAPREEYAPRCSCCPLLLDRATAFLVALDVETGVCVHVEHLDGDHTGRGFSLRIRSVDGVDGDAATTRYARATRCEHRCSTPEPSPSPRKCCGAKVKVPGSGEKVGARGGQSSTTRPIAASSPAAAEASTRRPRTRFSDGSKA